MYRKDIRLMAFVMSAMFWGSGVLANEVYVERIGDNSNVSITQYGSGNKVEGMTLGDPAIIAGDGNIVTVSQIGVLNTLKLSVGTSNIGGPGTGVTVTATADGSGNTQSIMCGGAMGGCAATTITSNITGNSNSVTQFLDGNATSSIVNVTGGANNLNHTASGAGAHKGEITVVGGTNNITLNQSGPLATNATISHNGTGNTITVTQTGQ